MNIPKGIDLGKEFEGLKKAMVEADELRIGNGAEGLINAYSRLYVRVERFVKTFDDAADPVDDLPAQLFQSPQK